MAIKGLLVCALLAAIIVGAVSSPLSKTDIDIKRAEGLRQLLVEKESARESRGTVAGPGQVTQTRTTRMDRLAHLSLDDREFMSRQIMQAISEMMNSECMSGRDYQGWVDFGRRSAEQSR
ncbi:cholecystokinin [Hypomesus transpacificus]|uniref:cholecystokinin n=1 Tax=Hypomesus transpacificus TaxID=137520 RepID=UPI001F074F8D|nr:cholecystokinin [Hypomesus transpacificus]